MLHALHEGLEQPLFGAVDVAMARGLSFWEQLMDRGIDIRYYDTDLSDFTRRHVLRDVPTDRFDESEVATIVEGTRLLTADEYFSHKRNATAFNVATGLSTYLGQPPSADELRGYIQEEITLPDDDAEVMACLAHMAITADHTA